MTSQTPTHRWIDHVYDRFDGRYISNAICKYGSNNFDIDTLAEVSTNEEALDLERLWICILHTTNRDVGYNLTHGGEQNFPTERVRQKHSDNMTKRWQDPEFRKLMKEKRTGHVHTEESKAKIGSAIKKCHENPEFSKKRFTPEVRAKMSLAKRNRKKAA